MHRFYLPPDQCQEPTFTLSGREAHHAAHVLRVQPHERVVVLDGAGHEFLCEVRDVDRQTVSLRPVQRNVIPALSYQLTLAQAIPKGKMFEHIVQKATELGAYRVVPLLSERTVTHLDDESGTSKAEKWTQVAIEAIKQCGSAWLPRIEHPVSPKQFLGQAEHVELALVGSLQDDRRHPRKYIADFFHAHARLPRTVTVWVGPEGDFTPAELNAIKGTGASPITLGPLVLRSDTAAVYCLSVLNYELQAPDWANGNP